ncbi:MAG: flagellar biosynthetic protein FliO [Rubrivivax sp.]
MRTVSTLPLSASQRLVTVEVGSGDDRLWLVLGVTAQNIHTLHTMAPPDPTTAAPTSPQTTFSHLLQRLRPTGSDDHAR